MNEPVPHLFEFDGFRLDATNYVLEQAGVRVHVPHKALELLVVLVRHRGEILGKEFLFSSLWPETVVEEANLTQNIYVLRKILGESAHRPQYIETIPRRGYRFHAEVREHDGLGAASPRPRWRRRRVSQVR
jgi:DNA-binding winged helix-turn-helix (wHTH) protein